MTGANNPKAQVILDRTIKHMLDENQDVLVKAWEYTVLYGGYVIRTDEHGRIEVLSPLDVQVATEGDAR